MLSKIVSIIAELFCKTYGIVLLASFGGKKLSAGHARLHYVTFLNNLWARTGERKLFYTVNEIDLNATVTFSIKLFSGLFRHG